MSGPVAMPARNLAEADHSKQFYLRRYLTLAVDVQSEGYLPGDGEVEAGQLAGELADCRGDREAKRAMGRGVVMHAVDRAHLDERAGIEKGHTKPLC